MRKGCIVATLMVASVITAFAQMGKLPNVCEVCQLAQFHVTRLPTPQALQLFPQAMLPCLELLVGIRYFIIDVACQEPNFMAI